MSHIYIISTMEGIAGDRLFKVGIADKVGVRLTQLQTGCPRELIVIKSALVEDAGGLERRLHSALREYHHAREWFKLPPTTLVMVDKLIERLSVACDCQACLGRYAVPKKQVRDRLWYFDEDEQTYRYNSIGWERPTPRSKYGA